MTNDKRPSLVNEEKGKGSASASRLLQESMPDLDFPPPIQNVDPDAEPALQNSAREVSQIANGAIPMSENEGPSTSDIPSSSQLETSSGELPSISPQVGMVTQSGSAANAVESSPSSSPPHEQPPRDVRNNSEDGGPPHGLVDNRQNGVQVQQQANRAPEQPNQQPDGAVNENPPARGPRNGYRRSNRQNLAQRREQMVQEIRRLQRGLDLIRVLRNELRYHQRNRNSRRG